MVVVFHLLRAHGAGADLGIDADDEIDLPVPTRPVTSCRAVTEDGSRWTSIARFRRELGYAYISRTHLTHSVTGAKSIPFHRLLAQRRRKRWPMGRQDHSVTG
jgi:hypothetical protein